MEKDEIKKGITKAGKHLKTGGIALISLPILAIIIYAATSQTKDSDSLRMIIVLSGVIYFATIVMIGMKLYYAGKDLIDIYSDNELENRIAEVTKEMIGENIKIGELEVLTRDVGKFSWDEAVKACIALGDGWRLPTKDELNMLYENNEKIGGFSNVNYWSGKEGDDENAWRQNFHNATQVSTSKSFANYVRAVRTI